MRIFLGGNLYAVTQHLLTRRNFLFLNSPRGFRSSLGQRAHFICFLGFIHFISQSKLSKYPLPTSFGLCYDDHLRSSAKDSHKGSHFRRLRDLIMGMTKVEKSKNPSKNGYDPIKNTYTVTKKDGRVKVRHLERTKRPGREIVRREATERASSPTSVALLAQ